VEYLTHKRDTNNSELIDRLLNIVQKDRFFQIFKELDGASLFLSLLISF
jgi:hypothetical protein